MIFSAFFNEKIINREFVKKWHRDAQPFFYKSWPIENGKKIETLQPIDSICLAYTACILGRVHMVARFFLPNQYLNCCTLMKTCTPLQTSQLAYHIGSSKCTLQQSSMCRATSPWLLSIELTHIVQFIRATPTMMVTPSTGRFASSRIDWHLNHANDFGCSFFGHALMGRDFGCAIWRRGPARVIIRGRARGRGGRRLRGARL